MTMPEVAVVLAVFHPDPEHLGAQLASLAGQSGVRLRVLAVVGDRVSGALITDLAEPLSLDIELVVPESASNSYDSFGLGLSAALAAFPEARVFALCDQDDIWAPDRLRLGGAALASPGVTLVHSDARVIDAEGKEIAPSLHDLERRKRPASLRDLLLANVVTGMTALFSREVAEAALPFPRQAALFFHHDLWIALVAFALGGIDYIDKPLVDYRQHGRNVVGAGIPTRPRHRIGGSAWRRHWGGTYYVAAYLAKALYLRMTELAAADPASIDRRKLSALRPYLSERGLGAAHLVDAVRMVLRRRPDLAAHSAIFSLVRVARAALAARIAVRGSYLPALAEFDRRAFASAPGVDPAGIAAGPQTPVRPTIRAASFADTRLSPAFDVRVDGGKESGVLVLVPSLNPSEVFAGIATAIDIAVGLAECGHSVTLVATDLPIGNPGASRAFVLSRCAEPQKIARGLSLVCGKTTGTPVVGPGCAVIATAWWSAHVARRIIDTADLPRDRFYYLVQDFEPGFYPWGADYAGAVASYDLGAEPIFNSAGLRDFFRAQGHFAHADPGLVFHPSIDIARYASLERFPRPVRRLAFYGRPEVSRNLFPTGILAIEKFLQVAELRPDEIEMVSVGLAHENVSLAGGHLLTSLGKIPWPDYPGFLATTDVGLSLMLSPHPSHPPIEMAAAGARVVTKTFGGKDLSVLTPAIQTCDPTPDALAEALLRAWQAPPVSREDRRFDLTPLGRPLPAVVSSLSERLTGQNVRRLRRA